MYLGIWWGRGGFESNIYCFSYYKGSIVKISFIKEYSTLNHKLIDFSSSLFIGFDCALRCCFSMSSALLLGDYQSIKILNIR